MSGRSTELFAFGWLGSVALVVLGTAVGYLGYPWITPANNDANREAGHLHDDEGHETGASRIVHIPAETQSANGLEIRRAEKREFKSVLRVSGTVSAAQERVARIRSLASGVVERVFVQLGDRVTGGDPLVGFDNIELGLAIGEFLAASADLESTRTNVEVNETILARSREMLEIGAVARTEHDVLEAEFRAAQAQVVSAQAFVARFEEQLHRFGLSESDLEKLGTEDDPGFHRTVSRATLRAPLPGIVTAHDVAVDDVIDPSNELLTIADISVIWVLANVSERDLSAVEVGKPVLIRVTAYPGESFRGRIDHAVGIVEQESRTARVRCLVRNPDARLKLGMFATVDIPSGDAYQAVAVPSEAVQEIQGRPVVFVQRSDTEFEQRPVETGLAWDGWIELESGVDAGDAVIAAGSSLAKEVSPHDLQSDDH